MNNSTALTTATIVSKDSAPDSLIAGPHVLSLPSSSHADISTTSPKVAEAIAAMRGHIRSTFMALQLLMILAISLAVFQNQRQVWADMSLWLPCAGLVAMFGALSLLPARLISSAWFPGVVVVLNAVITGTLFCYLDKPDVEAYTAYFLIILIASFFARTKRHVFIYSSVVTVLYAFALYQDGLPILALNTHVMRLPMILAAAMACGRAMESLSKLSNSDPVTGLPTKKRFMQLLARALKQARKSHQTVGVLVVEVHTCDATTTVPSDVALRSVVNKLVPLLGLGEVLARHERSSFAILKIGHQSATDLAAFAHECIDLLQLPLVAQGNIVRFASHIGVELLFPSRKTAAGVAFDNAKSAMKRAQACGRNSYVLYSDEMETYEYDRHFLETSLRKALNRNQLWVSYQPKVSLSTGLLAGTEALLRWDHPDVGPLEPSIFIPLAEERGLMNDLGEWILRAACLQWKAWQDKGLPATHISVNISPTQLRKPGLATIVSRILHESQLAPQDLELEITEGVFIEKADSALATLAELKALGVRLSIDDFGTGYSGLGYLTKLPIDALKIDQRFVRDIAAGYSAKALVKAMVNMALNLGLKVTAEGVEKTEEATFLLSVGCHDAQGYLYSKPLGPQDMEQYLIQEQHRQMIEATKSSLISALTHHFESRRWG